MENPKKKKDETSFDSEDSEESEEQEAEINPGKLDREELDFDIEGADNSKAHQPYEF